MGYSPEHMPSERLPEEEAHEEANMMQVLAERAAAGEELESEDYDEALAELESIHKDTEEESIGKKALLRIFGVTNLLLTLGVEAGNTGIKIKKTLHPADPSSVIIPNPEKARREEDPMDYFFTKAENRLRHLRKEAASKKESPQ